MQTTVLLKSKTHKERARVEVPHFRSISHGDRSRWVEVFEQIEDVVGVELKKSGRLIFHHHPFSDIKSIVAEVQRKLSTPLDQHIKSNESMVRGGDFVESFHHRDLASIFSRFGYREGGLGQAQVQEAFGEYGRNQFRPPPEVKGLDIFLDQFRSLPVGVLAASAGVSLATGGLLEALMIAGVLGTNAVIGYQNESQVEKIVQGLRQKRWPRQKVKREGVKLKIKSEELVPGDIIYLKRGEWVPADIRIIGSQNLQVDEASLTGESMPVLKDERVVCEEKTPIAEQRNMLFRGTIISGGACKGIVVATGERTQIGQLQKLVDSGAKPQTPLQKQMDTLGTELALASMALCGVSFGLGLWRGDSPLQLFKNTISLAVAAIPEGLPMVATSTLALGVERLKKRNMIVRHLSAVEALGAVHHICFDKTGTITLDEMEVVSYFSDGIFYPHSDSGLLVCAMVDMGILNNKVKIEEEGLKGSATEKALVELAIKRGANIESLRQSYPLLHSKERSLGRNYMITLHKGEGEGPWSICKGRPQEVLEQCHFCLKEGKLVPLDEESKTSYIKANHQMANDTLRVLGFAYQNHPELPNPKHDEWVWVGLVGMKDKIKDGVSDLIQQFHRAGLRVSMITGDQKHTAKAIGQRIGIQGRGPLVSMAVDELEREDTPELIESSKNTHVFARVGPDHKLKIVNRLQDHGRVVAMTGDGINDGPALKSADIGIAMGEKGSELAREVADIILLDDDLRTIINGIGEGRSINQNIKNSVEFMLTTNSSEILSTLMSQFFGLPVPASAMQYLWINLLTDIFPEIALAVAPPSSDVMEVPPRKPGTRLVDKSDIPKLGATALSMTGMILASYLLGLRKFGNSPQAKSMAFVTTTSTQLLQMLSHGSRKNLWQDRGFLARNPALAQAFALGSVMQSIAIYMPGLNRFLGLGRLGVLDLFKAQGIATLHLLVAEGIKKFDRIQGDS